MRQRTENRRLGAPEAYKVHQAIDRLLSASAPKRAILDLVARTGSPDATVFERYAGAVLGDVGAGELSGFSPRNALCLQPPEEGHLVRLACTGDLADAQRSLLSDVECAVNRLVCIADAIDDGICWSGDAPAARGMGVSFFGLGYLPERPGYRSAHVRLPRIALTDRATLEYFNEVDWRVLDHVAGNGRSVFQNSILPNAHRTVRGVHAPDGSDWDVRTRLASILECLELPLGFGYRFDCDTSLQVASVSFSLPPERVFPRQVRDLPAGGLIEVGERIASARMVYAMRLACLLAAACFGSGRSIERAFVSAVEGGRPARRRVLSCSFGRDRYVRSVLKAVDSGELAAPSLRFRPDALAALMAPERIDYVDLGRDGAPEAEAFDDGLSAQRVEPWDDRRVLPDDMQRLFSARLVRDIDTQHYQGGNAHIIDEARRDSQESAAAAIARLEGIAAVSAHHLVPPCDDAGARPLYCAHALSRLAVSLIGDDLAVGEQAEAFLQGRDPDEASLRPSESRSRYFRAPDALFNAYLGLSDLYQRLGDMRGAEAQADRCIALAPTTAGAYFRKADVLAEQRRFVEAANVLVMGLRVAISERDCSLLYYHLALLLWRLGRKREATAVYVYVGSLRGDYAEKARVIVDALRKRSDGSVIAHASPHAAVRELRRARIPVVPDDAVYDLTVQAAIGLACAHAPSAAAPYAGALAERFHDDRILVAACRSLQFGLGDAPADDAGLTL